MYLEFIILTCNKKIQNKNLTLRHKILITFESLSKHKEIIAKV